MYSRSGLRQTIPAEDLGQPVYMNDEIIHSYKKSDLRLSSLERISEGFVPIHHYINIHKEKWTPGKTLKLKFEIVYKENNESVPVKGGKWIQLHQRATRSFLIS